MTILVPTSSTSCGLLISSVTPEGVILKFRKFPVNFLELTFFLEFYRLSVCFLLRLKFESCF